MEDKNFYYKKDRLSQLRGFCAVVENECSIAKASKKLCLTSSAISKQISSLEKDMNIILFNRTNNNRIVITKTGEEFYKDSFKKLKGIENLFLKFKNCKINKI